MTLENIAGYEIVISLKSWKQTKMWNKNVENSEGINSKSPKIVIEPRIFVTVAKSQMPEKIISDCHRLGFGVGLFTEYKPIAFLEGRKMFRG